MSVVNSKRKQDEKNLKILRELASQTANRVCFDCKQKGPTYINTTIGSFVCTTCSGLLRGLNPPHRVKSISMASFTNEEIELLKSKGNEVCKSVWMGNYIEKIDLYPELRDVHKDIEFMLAKYEKKRYYIHPEEALKNVDSKMQQNHVETKSNQSNGKIEPSKSALNVPAPKPSTSPVYLNRPRGNFKGLSNKYMGRSSSLGLLSGGSTKSSNSTTWDKEFEPVTAPSKENNTNSGNFANFENANIFVSSPDDIISAQKEELTCNSNSPTQPSSPELSHDLPKFHLSGDCYDADDFSASALLIPTGERSLNVVPIAESKLRLQTRQSRSVEKKNRSLLKCSSLPSSLGVYSEPRDLEPVPFFGIFKHSAKSVLGGKRKKSKRRSDSLSNMYGRDRELDESLGATAVGKVNCQNAGRSLSELNIVRRKFSRSRSVQGEQLFGQESVASDGNQKLSAISGKIRSRLLSEDGWQLPTNSLSSSIPTSSLTNSVPQVMHAIVDPHTSLSVTVVHASNITACKETSDFSNLACGTSSAVLKSDYSQTPFISVAKNTENVEDLNTTSKEVRSLDKHCSVQENTSGEAKADLESFTNKLTLVSDFVAETTTVKSTSVPFSLSSNPLTPISPSLNALSSTTVPTVPIVSEEHGDRYAALKDLDEALKFKKEITKENIASDNSFNKEASSSAQQGFPAAGGWANFESNDAISTNPWASASSNPFVSPLSQPTSQSYNPFL